MCITRYGSAFSFVHVLHVNALCFAGVACSVLVLTSGGTYVRFVRACGCLCSFSLCGERSGEGRTRMQDHGPTIQVAISLMLVSSMDMCLRGVRRCPLISPSNHNCIATFFLFLAVTFFLVSSDGAPPGQGVASTLSQILHPPQAGHPTRRGRSSVLSRWLLFVNPLSVQKWLP